ncbi:bifunctional hydroxymethylpyrimidine kinase/phosphomethylpyrimidine kinase [Noviherbaspirillum saxi]|uniref:hydroxymethylpyrimidine kinase n=1 Tax=Noviherbaspirillum saxi TaxID=2320863 RepID=A0A3A3FU43_9BURK|nr:hydroxymethylpyrimidine/phosphomethylpyrimidine kinase [Noviherbaspirillum saxi]RJF99576.1 hydroxymethylpyrimidine/phosphomethylpyrimidine kinase [Noviherbaspirillum saxi]
MRPSVLVFAGSDPSSGAGVQADIQAIAALGAHPLSVITALTVQDNDRVYQVQAVSAQLVQRQAQVLIEKIDVAAVKIGIVGNRANAEAIAETIKLLRERKPDLHVVLDPVLASGHGDTLSQDNPLQAMAMLLPLATIITPNLPEAEVLCGGERRIEAQADKLLFQCPNVLIKGGHGQEPDVVNRWYSHGGQHTWTWPRLNGHFHGSGCTLASAIAALLALGKPMSEALESAQAYCQHALISSYAIADGQRIPDRSATLENNA